MSPGTGPRAQWPQLELKAGPCHRIPPPPFCTCLLVQSHFLSPVKGQSTDPGNTKAMLPVAGILRKPASLFRGAGGPQPRYLGHTGEEIGNRKDPELNSPAELPTSSIPRSANTRQHIPGPNTPPWELGGGRITHDSRSNPSTPTPSSTFRRSKLPPFSDSVSKLMVTPREICSQPPSEGQRAAPSTTRHSYSVAVAIRNYALSIHETFQDNSPPRINNEN